MRQTKSQPAMGKSRGLSARSEVTSHQENQAASGSDSIPHIEEGEQPSEGNQTAPTRFFIYWFGIPMLILIAAIVVKVHYCGPS